MGLCVACTVYRCFDVYLCPHHRASSAGGVEVSLQERFAHSSNTAALLSAVGDPVAREVRGPTVWSLLICLLARTSRCHALLLQWL
jgi:hypothetical protein